MPKGVKLFAVLSALALLPGGRIGAQHNTRVVPYDSIASKGTSYAGPGRDAAYDLPGDPVRIGIIAPLHGPQKADGEAIVAAAKLALEDANQRPLADGRRLALAVGDESGPSWGHAANALINLVFDQKAVAVLTSASGDVAHLSEQVGNRIGVPILTLASDSTTTQIDLAWIFRLGPSDAVQAKAIAGDIYRRGYQRVILVSARDHDGRVGSSAFEQAAQALGAPQPVAIQMNPLQPDYDALLAEIKTAAPQAVVIWTRSNLARALLRRFPKESFHAAVYLSQQASQDFSPSAKAAGGFEMWSVASPAAPASDRAGFVKRYKSATAQSPSATAAQAYDAVTLLACALRAAGPNRARVRDRVALTQQAPGVSGMISFDTEGNNRASVELVRVH